MVQPKTFSALFEPAQAVQRVPPVPAVPAVQAKVADAPSPSAQTILAGAVDVPHLVVSTSSPTPSPTFKPTPKPTPSPTQPPTIASYRIDYSPGYLADSGYYHFDMNAGRSGSYRFYYDEAGAKVGGAFAYKFTYTATDGSPLLEVQYSPLGGAHSASGLYHHNDYTLDEKGTYHALQGSKRETGTYAYFRFKPKKGGDNLEDAAFAYVYFPQEQTHGSLAFGKPPAPATPAPTKRPTPSPTKAPTVRPTAAPTTLMLKPSAEQLALPGQYRVDYSWDRFYGSDNGWYYFDNSSSHLGWYEFKVLDGAPRSIYGHPEAYRFDYKPSRYNYKQTTITVYYAPYNDPEPVQGLYHEGNTKAQQTGYYEMVEGPDREYGIYYYNKTGLYGGAGTLNDAGFYYLYFPYNRTRVVKPGFR